MIQPQHVRALKTIHNRLRKIETIWAITGSLSFALQGLEFKVNDIDLQNDDAGAYGNRESFHRKDYQESGIFQI